MSRALRFHSERKSWHNSSNTAGMCRGSRLVIKGAFTSISRNWFIVHPTQLSGGLLLPYQVHSLSRQNESWVDPFATYVFTLSCKAVGWAAVLCDRKETFRMQYS